MEFVNFLLFTDLNFWISHKSNGLDYLLQNVKADQTSGSASVSSTGGDLWSYAVTGKSPSGAPFAAYLTDFLCAVNCNADRNHAVQFIILCYDGSCQRDVQIQIKRNSGSCFTKAKILPFPSFQTDTIDNTTIDRLMASSFQTDTINDTISMANNLLTTPEMNDTDFMGVNVLTPHGEEVFENALVADNNSNAACSNVNMRFKNLIGETIYGFFLHIARDNHEVDQFKDLRFGFETDPPKAINSPSGANDYWSFAYLRVTPFKVPELGYVIEKQCNLYCNGKDYDDNGTVQLILLDSEILIMPKKSSPCTRSIEKILPKY